jgi:HEAT repeat protein
VQREAVQGLAWNGSQEAARILLQAITSATGRSRDALLNELGSIRDERAAPVFIYMLKHTNWRAQTALHLLAVEALGSSGAAAAVEPLKVALYEGSWWSPGPTKRLRTAAALALRKIGTAAALEALREASENGPRGVRAAARAEVTRHG